jgi:hypothetical protein
MFKEKFQKRIYFYFIFWKIFKFGGPAAIPCGKYGWSPAKLEIFKFFKFIHYEKFPKLPGPSQAVGANGLPAGSPNLKCFKNTLNFFIFFIFLFLKFYFEAFQV